VDRKAAVTLPKPVGRLAFVTEAGWFPENDITAADELCGREAAGAGLSGKFLAMLPPDTTASAASRFKAGAGMPNWVRTDGVAITKDAAAMFQALKWDAPVNVTAGGKGYFGRTFVWGGATTLTQAGTVESSCDSWAPASPGDGTGYSGWVGLSTVSEMLASNQKTPCSAVDRHVICLEE